MFKNNLFENDCKFYQQVSGTAIGTQFVPPHACIFVDSIVKEFLKIQTIKLGYRKGSLMISFLFEQIPRKI